MNYPKTLEEAKAIKELCKDVDFLAEYDKDPDAAFKALHVFTQCMLWEETVAEPETVKDDEQDKVNTERLLEDLYKEVTDTRVKFKIVDTLVAYPAAKVYLLGKVGLGESMFSHHYAPTFKAMKDTMTQPRAGVLVVNTPDAYKLYYV